MGLFKAGKAIAKLADKGLDIADQAIVDKDKANALRAHLAEIRAQALLTGAGQSVTKITICGLVSLVVGVLSWTFIFHPENMAQAIQYSTAVTPSIGLLIGAYTTGTTLKRRWKTNGVE